MNLPISGAFAKNRRDLQLKIKPIAVLSATKESASPLTIKLGDEIISTLPKAYSF
jgi:hypothetical protein